MMRTFARRHPKGTTAIVALIALFVIAGVLGNSKKGATVTAPATSGAVGQATVTTSQQTSTASADNPGTPDAPCSILFTLSAGTLRTVVTTTETGELVVAPYVNGTGDHGQYRRRDIPDLPPGVTSLSFYNVQSVDQIPSILYVTQDSDNACSVLRQGDPPS